MLRFLHGASVATLRMRARLVLDLRELQHLARGDARAWVGRAEWVRVCAHGRAEWGDGWETPKQALMRANRILREHAGVEISIETDDLENRIHVATKELLELVEVHERRARAIVDPEAGELEFNLQEIRADYQDRKFQLARLKRKYRMGADKIRKALERDRVEIRAQRRMRITETRSPEVVKKSLELHDAGASSRDVARVLGVTQTSALRFLRAHGRDTRPSTERDLPRREPPRSPDTAKLAPCERSAICA